MPIWRGFRLSGGAALLMALAGFAADPAQGAGAAYQVDTAEVSEPGNCKVESWASFAKNGDFIGSTSPDCVVSVFGKPVDFSAQFSRFKSDDEWGTAVFPKAKTNLIPTGVGQWGVAVSGSAAGSQVISGNLRGVTILGTGETDDLVVGNLIGTDRTGTVARASSAGR